MKIAVISDIHGNDSALEAVLLAAAACGVSRLFVLGDLTGYYYHPGRVLELLEPWDYVAVQGNHERMLRDAMLSVPAGDQYRQRYGSGLDCVLEQLDTNQVQLLINLPEQLELAVDGIRFLLCHGAPWDGDCYVYPDAPFETLRRCVVPGIDMVLMGHTHYPFACTIEGCTIVNPGSVGQARGQGGMADWLLIDTCNRTLVFRKTGYDPEMICAEVMQADPGLPYLHQVLKR